MLADFFITLVNSLISAIGFLGNSIIGVLPNSPFSGINIRIIPEDLFSALSWIIPFETILTIFNTSLIAVTGYYIYQVVLRWIKAIK